MAEDLSTSNDRPLFHRFTNDSTPDNLTEVLLPPWTRSVIITPVNGNVKVTHTGTDGAAIGAAYETVYNGGSMVFEMRGNGARALDSWPPSLFIASDTADLPCELHVEG